MQVHFKIIGILLIALSLIHVVFPRYFNWKNELKPLSLINRQIMTVHTFFIALTVLLIGLLCVFFNEELIETSLGKTITLGLSIFWTIRLFFQLFVYSPKLWKGKTFETSIHILFIVFWTYMSSIFLIASLK